MRQMAGRWDQGCQVSENKTSPIANFSAVFPHSVIPGVGEFALTHGLKITCGNSVNVAQFCGENVDLATLGGLLHAVKVKAPAPVRFAFALRSQPNADLYYRLLFLYVIYIYIHIQSWTKISAPLVNMIKGGCEN